MKLLDTVAAVSTPYGKGGVAMIRISGEDALSVGRAVFFPASGKPFGEGSVGRMLYGEIRMPDGEDIDDGMAVYFRGPHSFTGEDTVEITCHGGVRITARVLQAVLCAGARAAEAGEFTRRAYINGKMRVPDAPGIGVELDDEKVAFYHERWKNLTYEALNGERPDTDRHLSRCQF